MDVLSGIMKLYLILVFSAINEFNSFAAAQSNASKEFELMGFLPMEGTGWTGGHYNVEIGSNSKGLYCLCQPIKQGNSDTLF